MRQTAATLTAGATWLLDRTLSSTYDVAGLTADLLAFAMRNLDVDGDAVLTADVVISLSGRTVRVLVPDSVTAGREFRSYAWQIWRTDYPSDEPLFTGEIDTVRDLRVPAASPPDLLDLGGGYYLNRGNHTGQQAISTITGLQAALDAAGTGGSGNLDGGMASSVYGGTTGIDGGGA